MKITTKLFLFTGAVYILVSIFVVLLVNHYLRQQALHEAEKKAILILQRNLATHSYFNQQLKPRIFSFSDRVHDRDYFDPSWMSSTFAIREIDKHFHDLTADNYYYKECAVNARSPLNEADEHEKQFILDLNENPGLVKRSSIRHFDSTPFFTVLIRGESMDETCLRCHSTPDKAPAGLIDRYGPDRSFRRVSGEIVSAISIRIPLAEAYASASSVSLRLSLILLGIIAIALAVQYMLSRSSILKPLEALKNKALLISTQGEHLGELIPEPSGRELQELTRAFNSMSGHLKEHFMNLDRMIQERTAGLEEANAKLTNELALRELLEKERETLITDLQKAMEEVKTLSGFLPICASCKKIRDDKGYWTQIEEYIQRHSDANFSHGICPDCATKLYPEFFRNDKEQ